MTETLGDVESLLAALQRRVEQKCVDADKVAVQRAAEIQAAADSQITRAIDLVAARSRTDQENVARLWRVRARLDALHLTITAREALIDRVWSEAEARLRQLVEGPDYVAALGRLVALASSELRQPRLELAADPRGHALLTPARLTEWGKAAGVEFEAAHAPLSAWGGLLARAGRHQYDATFPARLELAREHLRKLVVERLGWEPV